MSEERGFNVKGAWRLADNQIREAMAEGKFDNLPGAGKPIPSLDQPYDPMWWVKKKIAEEQVKLTKAQAEALKKLFG